MDTTDSTTFAATEADAATVIADLRRKPRRVSSKYHYDERGSRLFEEITQLDEYYLTRTERALLEVWMPKWVGEMHPSTLVELGAGSAEKSRIALDAMVAVGSGDTYVPVDVSADFLAETAARLEAEYPTLDVIPTVGDITGPLSLPPELPGPRWIAFLGSTLGNFDDAGAESLMRRIATELRADDHFLLGVDLRPGDRKSTERIELAYNDAQGVTAAFSLNLLAVLNDEFGSDFDLEGFRHRSRYSAERGRIETFLDAIRDQTVHFPGEEPIRIDEGEAIRTEISCKYDRASIDALFSRSDLVVERWEEDDEGLYALVLAARRV